MAVIKTICKIFLFCIVCCVNKAFAQYPPPAGQPGTTAIYKDSSAFVAWATGCTVTRGLQDISNPGLGFVTAGDSSMALGMAGTNGIVSLGDGGSATLTFEYPIVNGNSWDFAVFENSFDDFFLELAFVEVSSNGIDFYRFPANSLTDTNTQVGTFDSLDASKINNLAGKYRALYGTPFDLEVLKNVSGLDVNHITHVKIIDVVGSLQTPYATYDSAGRKINDPWPTAFASGGFDLDAVGVIWNTMNDIHENNNAAGTFSFYPNPADDNIHISTPAVTNTATVICIYDITGRCIKEIFIPCNTKETELEVDDLVAGIYVIRCISSEKAVINQKLIIR